MSCLKGSITPWTFCCLLPYPVRTAEARSTKVGLCYEHLEHVALSPVALLPLVVKEGQSTLPQCLMATTLPNSFLAPRYSPSPKHAQAQFGL